MRQNLCPALTAALILFLLQLAGCARLPATTELPPPLTLTDTLSVDAGSPFALDRQGSTVALVKGGLKTRDLATGLTVSITDAVPNALAWSPDGKRLAAGFKGTIRVFSAAGVPGEEITLPGRVVALAWRSNTEILAALVEIDLYTFGASHRAWLQLWRPGEGESLSSKLGDATLKPLTVRDWGSRINQVITLDIAPAGDEIVFTRLHDPPAFPPYLAIVQRHLETGRERLIAKVDLFSAGARYAKDGERLIYGDGDRRTVRVDPWRDTIEQSYQSAGRTLARSPNGSWLFLDGRLYLRDMEVAAFPAGAEAQFGAGGRLLVRHGNRLHLLDGFKEPDELHPALPPSEGLLTLRRWRSLELITPEEYIQLKARNEQP